MALRLALGATRGRLVRQLLVECMVLALGGGLLGIAISSWTAGLLLKALPYEAAARVLSPEPDLRVALFALGLSLLTGIVFGLVPALQSTRPDLAPTLKNESGSVLGGSAPFRFRKGLVVAQVALSLLLLIGSGLFTRSLMNLRRLDPGFVPESILAFDIDPALSGHARERRYAIFKEIQEEIAAEPGVKSVSMADVPLMTNSNSSHTVAVEGYESKDGESMNPNFNDVAPGFFATLGIPLVAGRGHTPTARRRQGRGGRAVVRRYFYGDMTRSDADSASAAERDQDRDIEIGLVATPGRTFRSEQQRFVYVPQRRSRMWGRDRLHARPWGRRPSVPCRAIVRKSSRDCP